MWFDLLLVAGTTGFEPVLTVLETFSLENQNECVPTSKLLTPDTIHCNGAFYFLALNGSYITSGTLLCDYHGGV